MANHPDKIYDELLVLRCQDGERMAFTILVQRWQMPLTGFASLVCRDQDIGKEAVQESWLAIIRGINKLRDPARFRHWAFRIVHRKCIDLLRRRKFEPLKEDNFEPGRKELDGLENQDEIQKVLGSLSDNHRMVLALHYLHDMELKDIADLMDVPEGTVKSRLHHAKQAFRKSLEQYEVQFNERSG